MREFLESIQEAALSPELISSICQHHEKALKQLQFAHLVENGIRENRGRNARAITALLDLTALQEAEDPRQAVQEALEQLKKDSGYLFEQTQLPPPYAAGTGTGKNDREQGPTSLAEALRQRYQGK